MSITLEPEVKVRPKLGRKSKTIALDFGNNILMNLKLYTTIPEKESILHKGCPSCHNKVKAPNYCTNEACDTFDTVLSETVKVFYDGENPIYIPEEELEALLLPDGTALPDGEKFIVHSRLDEKKAYSMLTKATKKYYLVPESALSEAIYAITLHTMIKNKQALMVKFSLTSPRQNLGLIVEDNNQLVLCMIPYANDFRVEPQFNLPTEIEASYVETVSNAFMNFPVAPYETAFDQYEVAMNHLLKQKAQTAAIARELANPTPKKRADKFISLQLTRPVTTPRKKKEKVPA